ncbi:MAG: hypothetical protein WC119_02250 [Synergistaceae bacterium]
MKKDVNDWKQFRFGRDRHLGVSVSTEFYQPVPFFFTREGSNLNLIGHYRGSSLFIICNGPSLASGNYDLSLLKRPGIMTYGMNNGARTIRPNFWTCVDDPKRFLKSIWFDPCITKFVPHAHAEKPIFDNEQWQDTKILVGQCPNVIYYHRNEKFVAERFLFEDTINWGNSGDNGGGRSVMLPVIRIAFLLGFRTIYLLGADFKMSSDYTYHFDEQRSKGAVNCNMSTYDRLKSEYLPQLKPYLDAEGVQVFNCNPESELGVFDYMPYEQAIANASAPLGDVDNERTWGMYSKPEERQKWKQEPEKNQKSHLMYLRNRGAPVFDSGKPNKSAVNANCAIMPDKIPHEVYKEPCMPSKIPQMPSYSPHAPNVPPMPMPMQLKSPIEDIQPPRPAPYMPPHTMPSVQQGCIPETTGSRRIIKPLPFGSVSEGSSTYPPITIEDDGN